MVTKKDRAMQWMHKAVKFSEKPNRQTFYWLRSEAIGYGVWLLLMEEIEAEEQGRDFPDVSEDYLIKMSEELKRLIEALGRGSYYSLSPPKYEINYVFGKEPRFVAPSLYIFDDHREGKPSGLSVVMLHIMAKFDIHVLGRCKACGEMMFSTNKSRRKTCNAACRQKLFREKMAPDKKAKVHKRRVERYHQNKESDHGSKRTREG